MSLVDVLKVLFPGWLLHFLLTVVTLAILGLLLLLARLLWREWKRGEWYGNLTDTTRWSMHPFKEEHASGEQTGLATDLVLDALARAGHELQLPIWEPRLLLLRPTPPGNYEPAIISEFLSEARELIRISPPADDLCLEWKLHDVRLNDAVQDLQLKTPTGIDIGSVARFLMGMVQWFNAGEPVISGTVRTAGEKSVAIHLAAHGGRVQSVAVTASTEIAMGIDAMELSAERVAFKFLFRMRYPEMTNDQIDGFSALRQGATLFAQYAGTAPGMGEDAKTRTSSLGRAAFNFSFFRASIPTYCNPVCMRHERASSLEITDELRQAVLLAEGVAHALVGGEEERTRAIDCFRQLQDWPGSPETEALRRQAAYNEAIVWAQAGNVARAVLMLTELLGEKAPDTVLAGGDAPALPLREKKGPLPDSISFPARAARAAALARYDRESWSLIPESRVDLIAEDAERLVQDLDALCGRPGISAHDHRLMRYMYVETLRAAGRISLMRVIHNARSLYENARPTGLRSDSLDNDGSARLHRAISYMRTCEDLSPSSELYCDLAESYLLLKEFTVAEGFARHAILDSDPPSERAYYVAAESLWLQNTPLSKKMARAYLSNFGRPATLEELKSLEAEMAKTDGVSGAAA